ncbi:DUF1189 domain-containing protein [Candidatus Woesearchaeota archaeon]|nr:DUF1189 domain-containing protein [Candidatus Woesearchaeota archaeon]
MGLKNFFKTVGMSFNPVAYDQLSERLLGDTSKYFLAVLLLGFILAFLLAVPKIAGTAHYLNEQFNKFEKLDVNMDYEMKEAVVITDNYPLITIDTTKEPKEFKKGVLVTEDKVYYALLPFTSPKSFDVEKAHDLVASSGKASNLIYVLLLLMIPSFLVFGYLYFLIKFLLVVIAGFILALVIARIIRYGITVRELINVALYAATPMILIRMITLPFLPHIYYAEYAFFGLFLLMGIIKTGDFEAVARHRKR